MIQTSLSTEWHCKNKRNILSQVYFVPLEWVQWIECVFCRKSSDEEYLSGSKINTTRQTGWKILNWCMERSSWLLNGCDFPGENKKRDLLHKLIENNPAFLHFLSNNPYFTLILHNKRCIVVLIAFITVTYQNKIFGLWKRTENEGFCSSLPCFGDNLPLWWTKCEKHRSR